MADTWVLVADSAEARFYTSRKKDEALSLVDSLKHAASRAHPRDLVTDVPGRVHDRFGPARHSLDYGQQIRDEERRRFAREIADYLDGALHQKKFERLVVMAGPAFLGELRGAVSKAVAAAIVAEVPKDLVVHDAATIRANLP